RINKESRQSLLFYSLNKLTTYSYFLTSMESLSYSNKPIHDKALRDKLHFMLRSNLLNWIIKCFSRYLIHKLIFTYYRNSMVIIIMLNTDLIYTIKRNSIYVTK